MLIQRIDCATPRSVLGRVLLNVPYNSGDGEPYISESNAAAEQMCIRDRPSMNAGFAIDVVAVK